MDAYAKSKTPEGERDRRATPQDVFDRILDVSGIKPVLDVCADSGNFKINHYLTKEDDALSSSWAYSLILSYEGNHPAVWMNPPYSDPMPWVRKAYEESQKGLLVLGLLPDDRSTKWYREYVDRASVVFVPDRRISFLGPDGKPQNGNPKGSVFPLWTPWGNNGTPQEIRFSLDANEGE